MNYLSKTEGTVQVCKKLSLFSSEDKRDGSSVAADRRTVPFVPMVAIPQKHKNFSISYNSGV
jgi:hypothetical protein